MIIVKNRLSNSCVPYLLNNVDGNKTFGYENFQRMSAILNGLSCGSEVNTVYLADKYDKTTTDILMQVHDVEYLTYCRDIEQNLQQDESLINDKWVQPGVVGDTPFVKGMYDQTLDSVSAAYMAAKFLLKGQMVSYSVSRPPGHHAGKKFMGGYCYMNNAVVAMKTIKESGWTPVCLLDLDYHFGNGSSDIIGNSSNLFFISIHADTTYHYPYFSSEPKGNNQIFFPFFKPPSVTDYLEKLDEALQFISSWNCRALVVSIGYDIIENDPHGTWSLPASIFRDIGQRLNATGLPICFIQEGGYKLENLEAGSKYLYKGMYE